MENKHINAFWIGFAFAAGLIAWIYWIGRRKRAVTPAPLVVSRRRSPETVQSRPQSPAARQPVMVSDVLEEIKGIGPVFANRLNEAGILTFRQLASASPDELAEITGVTRWNPEDWIAEAARLAAAQ